MLRRAPFGALVLFLGRAVRGVGGGAWWRWVCMEGWEGAVDC